MFLSKITWWLFSFTVKRQHDWQPAPTQNLKGHGFDCPTILSPSAFSAIKSDGNTTKKVSSGTAMLDFWYVCICLFLSLKIVICRGLRTFYRIQRELMGKILLCSHHCPVGVKDRKMSNSRGHKTLPTSENIVQMTCNHCHVREAIIYVSFLQKHSVQIQ